MVSLPQAVRNGFRGYVDFRGRSTRSEYWFWVLFIGIANFVLQLPIYITFIVVIATTPADYSTYSQPAPLSPVALSIIIAFYAMSFVFSAGVLLPNIALMVRRLRDAGKRWTWIFLPLSGGVLGMVSYFIFLIGGLIGFGFVASEPPASSQANATTGFIILIVATVIAGIFDLAAIAAYVWFIVLLCLPSKPYLPTGYVARTSYGPAYPSHGHPAIIPDFIPEPHPVTKPDFKPQTLMQVTPPSDEDPQGWVSPKS